ncbi:MAG: hypothetical protein ACREC5_02785, partial [Thermoplasmata archaeon]
CDLGGGSLQLVATQAGRLKHSESLPLGALRLDRRYLEHDPPREAELEELRGTVREHLAETLKRFGGGPYRVIGLGGTVRALARASIEMRDYPLPRVHGYVLRDRDVEALADLLGGMPSSRRRAIPGIGADRADVVLAGLVVVEELLRAARAGALTVSGTGIREGVALEAIGAELPAPAEELALRSVSGLAETIGLDLEHGHRVEEIAVRLYELLRGRGGPDPSELKALRVAAWMHDAGIAVDLWRHPRHSAYLVRNVPIAGLDSREVLLASLTIRDTEAESLTAFRGKERLSLLSGADRSAARKLGAILQVAEWLQAARPRFSLGDGGKTLNVELDPARAALLSPRATEKARRPLQREFGREVRFLGD